MSCTRRNLYNLVFRLKTQNTINYLNVWLKTVVAFQAKSCLLLWIRMIPSQARYDRCCRLGSSISLVTTKRNRIQPSPGQSCHKAPLKFVTKCKIIKLQALTVKPRNTNRRCFACWGLRLFLRCRWHRLWLWCWQGGRPRVDTCQLRSGDTHNTSITPPLQIT